MIHIIFSQYVNIDHYSLFVLLISGNIRASTNLTNNQLHISIPVITVTSHDVIPLDSLFNCLTGFITKKLVLHYWLFVRGIDAGERWIIPSPQKCPVMPKAFPIPSPYNYCYGDAIHDQHDQSVCTVKRALLSSNYISLAREWYQSNFKIKHIEVKHIFWVLRFFFCSRHLHYCIMK